MRKEKLLDIICAIIFTIVSIGFGIFIGYACWESPLEEEQYKICEEKVYDVYNNGIKAFKDDDEFSIRISEDTIIVGIKDRKFAGSVIGKINNDEITIERDFDLLVLSIYRIGIVLLSIMGAMLIFVAMVLLLVKI